MVVPPRERDARDFVFDLSCPAGLVRGLGLILDFAMRTSEVGDTIVAPPRPRQGLLPAGPGPQTPLGALSINSNAPFAAEVQSEIEHLVARAFRRDSRLVVINSSFVEIDPSKTWMTWHVGTLAKPSRRALPNSRHRLVRRRLRGMWKYKFAHTSNSHGTF